ncbi:hypothetical protein ACT7DJ_14560 [Bacillus cereus]
MNVRKNGNSAEYKELWSISSVMSVKSIHKAKRKIKDAIKMLQKTSYTTDGCQL